MKKVLLILMALVLSGVLVVAGCGPSAPANQIVIGYPASLTGAYGAFGEGGQFGAQAAVDDINKQGGITVGGTKYTVKLIVVNTESDPLKGGTLAEQLILNNKVNVLMTGDEPPPMHINASNIADRYKIPYVISTGPMEPWLGARTEVPSHWPYTWAAGAFAIATPSPASDPRGFPTIVDTWSQMLDTYGPQTNKVAAVFAASDPDGVGWYGLFPQALKDKGYTVVGIDKSLGLLPPETTDFTSVINEWKAANVQILWGNAPAPFFGAMWKQAAALGFQPKMVSIGRAALFYEDVTAWGGNLPNGVCTELWWSNSFKNCPGIGGTTPQSLYERWNQSTGKPLNPAVGIGYKVAQVIFDAIQQANSLDGTAISNALASTNLNTIGGLVIFDENHFSRGPLVYAQWQPTTTAQKWALQVIYSKLPNIISTTAEPIFPIPYQ
jgi:branched-chain amino acid transport system substrate-binding protein